MHGMYRKFEMKIKEKILPKKCTSKPVVCGKKSQIPNSRQIPRSRKHADTIQIDIDVLGKIEELNMEAEETNQKICYSSQRWSNRPRVTSIVIGECHITSKLPASPLNAKEDEHLTPEL